MAVGRGVRDGVGVSGTIATLSVADEFTVGAEEQAEKNMKSTNTMVIFRDIIELYRTKKLQSPSSKVTVA